VSRYYGDLAEDQTLYIPLTTNTGTGGAVAPASAFEAADFIIYKNGSATQKTTTNGVTITSPFDSIVGLHVLAIDTSNDTGDSGFWVAGADYMVVLSPDETVDGETVVSVVATFSIENRGALRFKRSVNGITYGTVGGSPTPTNTTFTASAISPAASVTDQFKGLILSFDKDTTTAALRGQKTDITASTSGGAFTFTGLTTMPQSGDTFTIS
jgi:hypothetical protein